MEPPNLSDDVDQGVNLPHDPELPRWLRDELDNPVGMGEGRNNQMIRIGPSLIRLGHDADSLFELFCNLYDDLGEQQHREVMAVCRQSVKYAAKEDKALMKEEFVQRKVLLNSLARHARIQLPIILADYQWPLAEIAKNEVEFLFARREFLETLFKPDDVVWIGAVWETGARRTSRGRDVNYRAHFKTLAEWLSLPAIRGEFVSHCTFLPGTNSRCNENVHTRKFMVIESDLLTVDEMGAVINWLYVQQELKLRAIVSSGGKSIHAWFDWPARANDDTMDEWGATLQGLKCDPSTLRASQPVRLPGITRKDTKRPQSLLWLG